MAIVRCPRCRDEVTVPAQATSRALVRCPLCLEQYLLAEALANAPPLLVIIGGEVAQSAISDEPVVGHDYQLAAAAVSSPDNHWGHAVAATLPPRTATLRTGRRGRSREPNFALMLLSWIGGGALGLALAPLILWWVFRTDPIELGPTISAYAPWIVPLQFHGQPTGIDPTAEAADIPTLRQPRKPFTEKAAELPTSQPVEQPPLLPDLDTTPQPSQPETPAIEAPHTTRKVEPAELPSVLPPATKNPSPPSEQPADEPAPPPRPSMPNLTDLLP